MSQNIVCCPVHGALAPIHGPARIRWIVTHRDCFPAAGITNTDTPRQAKLKAIAYWARVDRAVNDWKAAGELDRFWRDRENGGASWQTF